MSAPRQLDELLELAVRVLDGARTGEAVEVYATHATATSVKVYDGEVETLQASETRGVGVRVVVDGRLGFAASSDLSPQALTRAVEQARANAAHTTSDPGNVLPEAQSWTPLDGIVSAELASVPTARKVEAALELERLTRAADRRVSGVSAASYGDGTGRMAVASTTGVRAAYEQTDAYATVVALARDGAETQTGFGLTEGRGLADLDLDAAAREAATRCTRLLGARKPPTATVPVVFDPLVAAQFLGVLGSGLSAESVQKGLSLFADRMGAPVATDTLSIVDDGRLVDGPGSVPVDDEGVPTRRTILVDRGRLAAFLHNSETAARAGDGARSTGNARRSGHRSPPGVAPTNLFFDGPARPPAELLATAGDGLYVQEAKGIHSGVNPISGEFSVGVTGLWIRAGALAEPVREVTVSSTLLEMLGSVGGLGDDRRFFPFGGALAGATLLLGPMTVAGA